MKKLLLTAAACAFSASVFAAGFQLSLTPDIAIQDRDEDINGVAIGVWNENPSSSFQWQFGFVNGTTGDSTGVQWFVFLPTIYNYAENFTGVQFGWVNNTTDTFKGWQNGFVNIAGEKAIGLQSGAVNYAADMHGVQLGVVNYATTVSEWAFQVGLVNIIADNPWFKEFPSELAQGMVIVNWSFGGSK